MTSVLPRYATPRDLSRPTDAASGALVAHLHGRPWLPWQRYSAEVAGEKLPNGRYAYSVIIITVPRQCGKTALGFDIALGRAGEYREFRAAYAAQTGHVSSERFTERIGELEQTALRTMTKGRLSGGTERITFTGNKSYVKAFPPKAGALRSNALDLVIVDEAQEHGEELGKALDATILPTFSTRPRRQLMIIGTAGTAWSKYLRRYMDMALDGAPGMALIEFGAMPTDDLTDDAVLLRTHPGLAYGLTDLDFLGNMRDVMGIAGFLREFGNVWTAGDTASPVDAVAWLARALELVPLRTPAALAFDVDADRSTSSICASELIDGLPVVRVLEERPGDSWLEDRMVELAKQFPRAPIYFDALGPGVNVGMALATRRRLGDRMKATHAPEYAAACIGIASAANTGKMNHYAQPPLDLAVAAAEARQLGDRWVWNRHCAVPIASLIAATLAYHGAVTAPALVKPSVGKVITRS